MSKIYGRKLNAVLLLFLALQCLSAKLFAQQETLTWLGTLGGSKSSALGVSDDGSIIVGSSNTGSGSYHAFRWTAAHGMQDLHALGGDESEATGVSSDGSIIVGWAHDTSSIYRAFKWTVADSMQNIGAGDYSKATGVSGDGSVIIVNISPIAYRWTSSGGLENLGNLGGSSTGANAVSSNGSVIVGFSNDSVGDPYAFRWVAGTVMEKIGTFYSFAKGVSGDGATVTGFETGSAGLYRAFRWKQAGGFEFSIAGNFSQGNAVSGDGSVLVGDNGGGAFRLSTTGGLEQLNQVYSTLLSPGSELYSAMDISADGKYIVGLGLNGATGHQEGFLLTTAGITSVAEAQNIHGNFVLNQNYPNPFNPTTGIGYRVSGSGLVTLKVYDLLGREVAVLVNEQKVPGSYSVRFDAAGLASGVYLYRLQAGSFAETKKLMFIR